MAPDVLGPRSGLHDHWQLWVGATQLEDGDIVLGESRQIVFVDPADPLTKGSVPVGGRRLAGAGRLARMGV